LKQNKVRLYTLSTCSHCKAAKRFLSEHGIEYEYTDVDLLEGKERADMIEEVRRYNPRCTFPTILIGDEVIIGNNPEVLGRALGIKA